MLSCDWLWIQGCVGQILPAWNCLKLTGEKRNFSPARKTGTALKLPLTVEAGNAVAEYILNARPKTEVPYVFLRLRSPFDRLNSRTPAANIMLLYQSEGFRHESGDGKSFHAFRRTMGTRLIRADIPLTTVSQILGHTNLDSTKRYLYLHDEKLLACCMDLSKYPCRKEGLVWVEPFIVTLPMILGKWLLTKQRWDIRLPVMSGTCKLWPLLHEALSWCSNTHKRNCFGWCQAAKGNGKSAYRANTIRNFGKYLTAIGKEAYVLPTEMFVSQKADLPYLFTDEELEHFLMLLTIIRTVATALYWNTSSLLFFDCNTYAGYAPRKCVC